MEQETVEEVREALIDLYLKVKVRSSEEIEQYNSDQMRQEKDELKETTGITLIEYIRSNVEILLNIKSDDGDSFTDPNKSLVCASIFSKASSIMSNNLCDV